MILCSKYRKEEINSFSQEIMKLLRNSISKRIVKSQKKFADMKKKGRGSKQKNIKKIYKKEEKEETFAPSPINNQDLEGVMDKVIIS